MGGPVGAFQQKGLGDMISSWISTGPNPPVSVSQITDVLGGDTTGQFAAKAGVVAKLEALAASHHEKLNWKVSIVDLLKLLGLESSFAVRKELAVELGCPAEKMGDSAQMNMWLHKTVLRKLAENGGNIPKELLD